MRYVLVLLALLSLGGCVSQQNVKEVLGNLDRDCVRHYQGSAGTGVPVGQATITFTIDCKPSGTPALEPVK